MFTQGRTVAVIARGAVIAVMVLAGTGATTLAAAPANDDRDGASPIAGLPFSESRDTTEATSQEHDPECFTDEPGPSVWYSFTPRAEGRFVATTVGSDYDTTLTVAVRSDDGLEVLGCDDDSVGDFQSRVVWRGSPGQEYLLFVGSWGAGGQLEFDLRRAPRPPTFEIGIARKASLTDRGGVEVRGSLRCRGTDDGPHLTVLLRQDANRRIIRGQGGREVACGESWTIRARNQDFLFAPGRARVRAILQWCNNVDCISKRARRVVQVR